MEHTSLSNTKIDFIPGLPPDFPIDNTMGGRTNTVMRDSMPIVTIYPGVPAFTEGTSLYKRKPYFKKGVKKHLSYSELLEKHGFTLSSTCHKDGLTLAYLADSFPTDSFANEYGENFLQGLTDVSSTAAASLAQMTGNRTGTDAIKSIGAKLKENEMLKGTVESIEKGGGKALEILKSLPMPGGGKTIDALAAGSRLDFPMVWKGSSFQPSYTMTIRLYNPFPGSQRSTRKYIAGPIAAIMLLGTPISTDGHTFSWPFIHRICSPGIYDLDPAFISNITIIKGGDQQQIGFNQRLGIVDVRIDFGSLFSSMMVTSNKTAKTRPTLKTYIDGISDHGAKKNVTHFSKESIGTRWQLQPFSEQKNNKLNNDLSLIKKQSPTSTLPSAEEKQNPKPRIDESLKQKSKALENKQPSGINPQ